jgi:hypothetical protein
MGTRSSENIMLLSRVRRSRHRRTFLFTHNEFSVSNKLKNNSQNWGREGVGMKKNRRKDSLIPNTEIKVVKVCMAN